MPRSLPKRALRCGARLSIAAWSHVGIGSSGMSSSRGVRSRRSIPPPGLLPCAVVALSPVPSECDEAANYVGGQPRGARDVPQRRVFVLGMPAVRRPHVRLAACQYPSARTWGPVEAILHHSEGARGNPLAVLELSQRPLGHRGRLGKCPPVPHAQLDPARDDVIGEPPPVLTGHVTVLPASRRQSPHWPVTILTRRR